MEGCTVHIRVLEHRAEVMQELADKHDYGGLIKIKVIGKDKGYKRKANETDLSHQVFIPTPANRSYDNHMCL